MANEPRRFTRIKGVSDVRRLPRIGKIRLGIKKKSASGKEYPAEVPHFVCPQEVKAIYGETPTSLDVMIPLEDETFFFPQAYKWYAASHLKCKGDGETAMRRAGDLSPEQKVSMKDDLPKDENALVEMPCPCPLLEEGKCSQQGNLMVLLPKVSMGGVYQINTGSFHNFVRINSAIEYTRALIGRVALVPMVLRRMPESIEYLGKKATHYLLSLEFQGGIQAINAMRQNSQLIMENVKHLALPPAPAISSLPPPAPVEEDDAPPLDASPENVMPPVSDAVVSGPGQIEITVSKAEKTTDGFKITTPAGIAYYTDKREIAVAAWEAQKSKKPLRVIVCDEDGVMFITGVAA